MGSSSWDDAVYTSKRTTETMLGVSSMGHSDAISKGKVKAEVHETLNPAKMKSGKREARDSAAHPETVPIFIGLDVTGSMRNVPAMVQQALPKLMGLLIKQGFVTDPAICVSAIGDAAFDSAPLQIGQFESGIEVDNDIANIFMEGGGGGNMHESYELALYFLSNCVSTDAWEKRQKRGYAFIVCDEELNLVISRDFVRQIFGSEYAIEANLDTEEVLKQVQERWNLFVIIPKMTAHFDDPKYSKNWRRLLGQNVLKLDDPNAICELIASTIGVMEESVDLGDLGSALSSVGASSGTVDSVTRALSTVSQNRSVSNLSGTGLGTL